MLYKTSHDTYGPYQAADFLKLKFKASMEIPRVKPQIERREKTPAETCRI